MPPKCPICKEFVRMNWPNCSNCMKKINELLELPDKGKGYSIVILGFIKSGSTSMIDYMKEKYPNANVMRKEILGKDDVIATLQKPIRQNRVSITPHQNKIIPVIIMRNPIDAAWSSRNYFRNNSKISIDEFFIKVDKNGRNPINLADLNRHIEPIKKHYEKFMLFQLESLQEEDDTFPHKNISKKHIIITSEFKKKFLNVIKEKKIDYSNYYN